MPKRNVRLTVTVVATDGNTTLPERKITTVVAEDRRTQIRTIEGTRHLSADAQAVVTPEGRILLELRLASSFSFTTPDGKFSGRGFNQEISALLESGVSRRITDLDDAPGEFGVTVDVLAEIVK